ncbi:glutaredoxin family protein [Candidatus Bathyarchaeota archaeon]|nr:glutaredoxin family protein [Candidatus Bathyarchaeota archaeon]
MEFVKVPGEKRKHKVLMYAISTCVWCKLTKSFLKEQNVEYEYVDVDLIGPEEREKVKRHILEMGGRLSYPAIIIDDELIINGFRKDKLTEVLEL